MDGIVLIVDGGKSAAKMAGRISGENGGKKVEKFGAFRTIRSATGHG